jgi:hypothetical protein
MRARKETTPASLRSSGQAEGGGCVIVPDCRVDRLALADLESTYTIVRRRSDVAEMRRRVPAAGLPQVDWLQGFS